MNSLNVPGSCVCTSFLISALGFCFLFFFFYDNINLSSFSSCFSFVIVFSCYRELMLNHSGPYLEDITLDMLVCAFYEQESSWHRGLAEKTSEKRGVKMVCLGLLIVHCDRHT